MKHESTDRLQQVIDELRRFVEERDWSQFHDPKNLAMAVSSEAGELAALYRWVKSDEADELTRDEDHREQVAGEVADVGIFLVLLCERIGIDLPTAMLDKIAINRRNHPVEQTRGRADRVRPREK